ncbi:hypothetical protein UFOVP724_8 [uncultured Caudovirales phage]|uniref:Uncharacterized protein n=1 Tax=uncultured Caudovirales phage TaxID=2100421 RepID=A0A6J5NLS3_9CAUD|nr:hypothetical protein UFOVP724_8 [uncultured Caudovirales phage]
MSLFKTKKELYLDYEIENFNYDPTNPYTGQVEDLEEFIEVPIRKSKDVDQSDNEPDLPTEQ